MLAQTGLARPRRRGGRPGSRAATSSASTSPIGLLSEPSVLLLDEPSASLDPRQRERLWEFIGGARRPRHDGRVLDPQRRRGRALRRAACCSWPTASCCSPARRPSSSRRSAVTRATSRRRSCASCTSTATDAMRWLFVKDLQILRRSPLLVGLLVVYPIAIALMIGFALSSPPGKPKVAFYNEVPHGPGQRSASATRRSTSPITPSSCSSRSSRSRSTRATEAIAEGAATARRWRR